MKSVAIDDFARWTDGRDRAGFASVVIRATAAAIALAAAGCVAAPRPADSSASAQPAATRDEASADKTKQARLSDPRTDFHEKATDRQQFQVHIDFGRVFEAQGNLDAAILEYQDALSKLENKRHGPFRPSDEALAHRRIGSALDRQGRFAQAETHYKKALKLSPKDPKIWNDAGYSYYLQGRWADAEHALKTAARFAPEDERIRTNLGLTLAAAGKSDQALPLLSQSNGDAIGHANLGYLLAATGQTDLARRQYETALAMRPDLELARRALARIDHSRPDSRSAGEAPTQIAANTGTTSHSVDSNVNKTAIARPKIPPPMPIHIRAESGPAGVDDSRATVPPPPPL